MSSINPLISGLKCIRCHTHFPIADYFEGCPECARAGYPASLAFDYLRFPDTPEPFDRWQVYPDAITIGKGATPLIDLAPLARELGISALALKYEGANPTGSHKDRMSRFVVERAREIGARTVAAASSGNAGVSLAAYAAEAGLDCVIVTTRDISEHWSAAIKRHGADLIFTETVEERWTLMAREVREGSWYPATNFILPAVGSNPFGVDGYRSIALELQKQAPDCTDVIVPTSRGDLLWGIAQGFHDLVVARYRSTVPRLHAVEPFPRLRRVLAGADYRGTFSGTSDLTSIGGSTVTFQALAALQSTQGSAIVADNQPTTQDQLRLCKVGVRLELSSASALTGLRGLLRERSIHHGASVILLGTATERPNLR